MWIPSRQQVLLRKLKLKGFHQCRSYVATTSVLLRRFTADLCQCV
ncbi:hypothetical protein GCK32_011070 [Trichostrongylus colubriformis]|uniref:Uncharacterized protein n=1 Tax=Trichostrongylus colubriformis TaxID=6319 RepID=A0AAN8IDI4_TRICO